MKRLFKVIIRQIITIYALLVFFAVMPFSLPSFLFFRSVYMHIANGSVVEFHGMKVVMPLRWSLYNTNDAKTRLTIIAVPPLDSAYYGMVSFYVNDINADDFLYNTWESFNLKDGSSWRVITSDKGEIGGEPAVVLVYEIPPLKWEEKRIQERWHIPSKKITLSGDYPYGQRRIFEEILDSVEFTQ